MATKPYDATVKTLLKADPASWLRLVLGREAGPARLLIVDLATVVSEADEILQVKSAPPWLVHVEFQSSYDAALPLRLQRYDILVRYRHELPVQSVAVLLRREADGPGMTGELRHALPDGRENHRFRFDVLRAWQLPVDRLLAGCVGTLPLAPLSDEAAADLDGVAREVQNRLRREAGPEAKDLWLSTCLLMGLRYNPDTIRRMAAMSRILEDSVFYHMLVDKGRAEGLQAGRAESARQTLIRLGTRRFGPPDEATAARVAAVADAERLQALCERTLEVDGWDAVLADG